MIFDRLRAVWVALSRVTLIPLLVRAGIFVTTLVSFVFAYPIHILAGSAGGLLVVAAVLPAIRPRRTFPTLAVLLAVAGWLLSTTGYGQPVVPWRLLGLAGALYLTHSLCALAAALPYDAIVGPEVVARWVLRALGVVLATAVLSILLSDLLPGGGGSLWAVLGGLVAAVGVAVLLAGPATARTRARRGGDANPA